jgi:hypothetical protein
MGIFSLFKSNEGNKSALVANNMTHTDLPEKWVSPKDAKILTSMLNSGEVLNTVANGYLECKRINANIEALRTATSADLQKHIATLQYCERAMMSAFAERGTALKQNYRVLDKALESNDRQLILAALQGISSIVTKDPLESIEAFSKRLLDKSKPLELDF